MIRNCKGLPKVHIHIESNCWLNNSFPKMALNVINFGHPVNQKESRIAFLDLIQYCMCALEFQPKKICKEIGMSTVLDVL